MIKKIICLIILLNSTHYLFSQNSKEEKIKTFLELTGSAKLGKQVTTQLIASYKKIFPDVPEGFWEGMENKLDPTELVNLITPIYSKYYSEEEIDKLIAFYQSDIGKKITATLPKIVSESMEIGKSWGEKVSEQVLKELKEKGYNKSE